MFDETNGVRNGSAITSGGSRRERQRAATTAEILGAAWTLARTHGLTGWSMRDLARAVGLGAASLYAYFPSKHAIHDAMFRQGYEEFLVEVPVPDGPEGDPSTSDRRATTIEEMRRFFDFCAADPVRYQLLFQRVVPGFEPSPASYALAVEAYETTIGRTSRVGFGPAEMDLATAIVTGLVNQQLANDPGGHRWRDLLPLAADALLAVVGLHDTAEPPARPSRRTR